MSGATHAACCCCCWSPPPPPSSVSGVGSRLTGAEGAWLCSRALGGAARWARKSSGPTCEVRGAWTAEWGSRQLVRQAGGKPQRIAQHTCRPTPSPTPCPNTLLSSLSAESSRLAASAAVSGAPRSP